MKKQKIITLKRFFLFYRYFPTIVCILGSVVCVALRLSSILTGRDDLTRASLIALVVFSACSLLYDYFFGKTLDKVRPGGVIAFITSKGTMDKEDPSVRKYLAQRADLIGAAHG